LISTMRCNDVLVSQQIVVIVSDVKSPPKLGEKIGHSFLFKNVKLIAL